MEKEIITTDKAPSPGGPYSQGIRFGNLVFTAGQVGFDPATGRLSGDTITEQTEQALQNILAVLVEAGLSSENVVKTTVFLSDLSHFADMNAVFRRFFAKSLPARSTVGVDLPPGILVEIEAVAVGSKTNPH